MGYIPQTPGEKLGFELFKAVYHAKNISYAVCDESNVLLQAAWMACVEFYKPDSIPKGKLVCKSGDSWDESASKVFEDYMKAEKQKSLDAYYGDYGWATDDCDAYRDLYLLNNPSHLHPNSLKESSNG